jgi:hypothetical protein
LTAFASSGATHLAASSAETRPPEKTNIAKTVQIATARANHSEVSLFHRVILIAPFSEKFCEAPHSATKRNIFHPQNLVSIFGAGEAVQDIR